MDTLFDKFYNIKDEVKAQLKKPFVRRKLKLRFQSALASIAEEESKLQSEIQEINEKVEELNINRLLEIDDDIERLARDRVRIKSKYTAWFGKEMIDVDDE